MSGWLHRIRNSSTRRSFTILKSRTDLQENNLRRRRSTSLALRPADDMPTLEEVIRNFEENYLNLQTSPAGSSKSPKKVSKKAASLFELSLKKNDTEEDDECSKSFSVASSIDAEGNVSLRGENEKMVFEKRRTLKSFFSSARWKRSKPKLTKMDATTQTTKFTSDFSHDSGCYGSSDNSSDSSTLRKIEMLPVERIEYAKCQEKKIEIEEDPWTILENLKSSLSSTSIEDSAFYSKMFSLSLSVEDAGGSQNKPEETVQEKVAAGCSKPKRLFKSKSCSNVSVKEFRVIANDSEVECKFRVRSKSCVYEEIQAIVRKLDVSLNSCGNEASQVVVDETSKASCVEQDVAMQEDLTKTEDVLLTSNIVYV